MTKISKHNKSVIRRAVALRSYGWKVRADVPGFSRPTALRVGRQSVRPDIIAKKRKETRIIEVETPSSFEKDVKQRKLLRRYASNRPGTKFMVRRVWW